MDPPASGDRGAIGAGKCAAFGSVGMRMALPKPAGAGALGASAANQAFKRQRTAPSVRCQDGKGADLMDEEYMSHVTGSKDLEAQGGEEDAAEENRCPLCHQLTAHPLQEQEFGHVDMAYSGRGPQRLRQALSRTSVTPHQLMVTGGLLLAAFLGGNMLRWTLKRRRRKGHGVAATEMEEEGDAGRDTGDLEGRAISNDAAPGQESGKAFSEAQEAYIAHQASGRSPGMSFAVETGGMQRHASAVIPKRPLPRRLLARGASPEELNRSLYQYAALALDQAGGSRATRR